MSGARQATKTTPSRMIQRDPIHPEFPFTEAEFAAALILLGCTADDAIRESAVAAAELPSTLEEERAMDAEGGRVSFWPRIHFVGSFGPVIHLAADILSSGTLLSEPARAAWLEEWELRLEAEEADRRIARLERLGPEWSARRSAFFRLLTAGTL